MFWDAVRALFGRAWFPPSCPTIDITKSSHTIYFPRHWRQEHNLHKQDNGNGLAEFRADVSSFMVLTDDYASSATYSKRSGVGSVTTDWRDGERVSVSTVLTSISYDGGNFSALESLVVISVRGGKLFLRISLSLAPGTT